MGNALLKSNPHFETLVAGITPAYETVLPGENPLVTRSFVVTKGAVRLAFPAGTTFQKVAATANAMAHTRVVINGVHVILPDGVEPWTGERVVELELRANSVEPQVVTRPCWRNWRLVLDNVRPTTSKPAGRMVIEAARDSKITVIRDGMVIHNGGCVKFPETGTIRSTAKPRGPGDSDRVHAPERGDGTGFFYR